MNEKMETRAQIGWDSKFNFPGQWEVVYGEDALWWHSLVSMSKTNVQDFESLWFTSEMNLDHLSYAQSFS